MTSEGFLNGFRYGGERNFARQKALDCDLIRSIQGASGGPALLLGLISELQKAELFKVRS